MTTGMSGGSVHLALSISSVMGMWPASGAGWLAFGLVGSSGIAVLLKQFRMPVRLVEQET
jgi:hypothetical protein